MGELELQLKNTIAGLVELESGSAALDVHIYRLRDISKLYFSVISETPRADTLAMSPALCQKLLDCYSTGEYCFYPSEAGGGFYFFPIKAQLAYNNSVLLVETNQPIQAVLAIGQLLTIYQNYISLLNDNERDNLTGLLNRKTFDNRINKILSLMQQKTLRKRDQLAQSYYLAIFDIDHFKRVNDEFGHLIGDEVLLLFSQLMMRSFREADPVFRFGGEEFVSIIGCEDDHEIATVLTRFNKTLSDYRFPQVGPVTVSIGCTKLTADTTPSQLMDRADLALYYAKNNGRNQVCFYEQLLAQGHLKEDNKAGDIELF